MSSFKQELNEVIPIITKIVLISKRLPRWSESINLKNLILGPFSMAIQRKIHNLLQ